mgnify:CR=1 FL=1
MADNQMVKIVFDFDLGNVPASAKKLSQYLKDNNLDLKFTKASVDGLSASLGQLATQQTKAGNAAVTAGNSIKKSNQQWTNFALILQDLPYGFRGIQNNLPAVIGGFAGMTGPIYLAGSALIAFFTAWDMGFFKSKTSADKLKEKTKELRDEIIKSTQSAREQGITLMAYVGIARDVTQSETTRNEALEKANEIYGRHNEKLTLANINTERVKKSLDGYIQSLIQLAVAEKYAGQIADNIIEQGLIQADIDEANVRRQKLLSEIRGKQTNESRDILIVQDEYASVLDEIIGLEKEKATSIANGTKTIELHSAAMKKAVLLAGKYGRVPKPEKASGKSPEELAKEKARLEKEANDAETKAFIDTLDERAQKEYKAGLELADNLEKMKAAGYTDSITYYSAYRQNMLNIAKEYDDKAAKEQEKRDKEAADAAKKIDDRDLQNSLTALKIQSDVATKIANSDGKATASDRIKILEDYKNKLYDLASVGGWTADQFDKIADALVNVDAAIEGSKDKIKDFKISWTETINNINGVIRDFINNSLYALGESIGKALAGENVDVINVFGTLIADALQSIGKELIAFATVSLAAWTLLKTNNPATAALALVAGIAAVAAGAAMKSQLAQDRSGGKQANSGNSRNSNLTKKFANGGIISGPTYGLMGEYPGAKTNPEVVAPLDKLKDMIGGGGGGTFMLRGQDLLLSVNRAQKASNLKGQNISLA